MLCPGMNILSTDEYLSYLPLAHIFERCMQWAMLWVGARVGFYSGNIKTLKCVNGSNLTVGCRRYSAFGRPVARAL